MSSGGPKTTTNTNDKTNQNTASSGTGTSTGQTNVTGATTFNNAGTSSNVGGFSNQGMTTNNGLSTGFTSYNPWAPTAPLLSSLLGQTGSLLSAGAGPNAAQAGGTSGLESAAGQAASLNPKILGNADYMLGGGGFGTGVPGIQTGYSTMLSSLMPYATGQNLDPLTDPALQGELSSLKIAADRGVGDTFSAAGRGGPGSGVDDPNGAFARARAEAENAAWAQPVLNYEEQARNQQLGAANDILSGAINTGNALDQSAGGRLSAMNMAPSTIQSTYNPWSTMFQAGTAAQQQPVQQLGMLSSLFSPLAGEFGSSSNIGTTSNTGTADTTGTNAQYGTTSNTGGTTNQSNIDTSSNNAFNQTGTSQGTSVGKSVQQQQQDPFMTMLSGLGLLGSIATAPLGGSLMGPTLAGDAAKWLTSSDPRMKKDIQPVGMLFDGTPVHKFKYKGQKKTQIGLMAPQVQARAPQAVATNPKTGMQMVNYDLATRAAARAGAPMLAQGMA